MRRILLGLLGLIVAAPAAGAARWEFHFDWPDEAAPAQLQACGDAAQPRALLQSEGGAGHLLSVARRDGRPVQRRGDRLALAGWRAGECIALRVDVVAAGRDDRYGLGYREGQFLRLSPQRWLWRPPQLDPDSRLHLRLPPGWRASVPWQRQADGSYRLGGTPADWPAVTAFGRFTEHALSRAGGTLRVARLPLAGGEADTRRWLAEVTGDLLQAYGRLPLADVQVLVVPLPGVRSPVPWGQVTRGGGSAVQLFVGADAGYAGWRADWTATHEFAHLLHPFMGNAGRWLGEGLASYYQNVLRARSGALSADEATARLRAGFERGRLATPADAPALADAARARQRGSTMRIYWAGAAFWLQADLALRQRGDSLDGVLDRFARAHLPASRRWQPEEFIAALADLAPLFEWHTHYRQYAASRRFPDVDASLAMLEAGLRDGERRLARGGILQPAGPVPSGP